jgi:hypothetical protein
MGFAPTVAAVPRDFIDVVTAAVIILRAGGAKGAGIFVFLPAAGCIFPFRFGGQAEAVCRPVAGRGIPSVQCGLVSTMIIIGTIWKVTVFNGVPVNLVTVCTFYNCNTAFCPT